MPLFDRLLCCNGARKSSKCDRPLKIFNSLLLPLSLSLSRGNMFEWLELDVQNEARQELLLLLIKRVTRNHRSLSRWTSEWQCRSWKVTESRLQLSPCRIFVCLSPSRRNAFWIQRLIVGQVRVKAWRNWYLMKYNAHRSWPHVYVHRSSCNVLVVLSMQLQRPRVWTSSPWTFRGCFFLV